MAGTLAKLALPNAMSMLVMAAYSIAEAFYAGQLGVDALASLALVYPLAMLTQMLSAGSMGGGMAAAVARALGQHDAEKASRIVVAAFVIAFVAASVSALIMMAFGPAVFRLLGGTGAALDGAVGYAAIYFPFCFAIWFCNAAFSVLRGSGNMGVPAVLLVAVSLSAVPMSGALALGWGALPSLGIAGLALGQVIAFGAGGVLAVGYIVSGRAGLSLKGAVRGLRWLHFREILKVGMVASLNPLQTVLIVVLMVGLVGQYGPEALAGYGLGARLEFLMVPVVFGIGTAMTAMVGANIGAGASARALRIAWTGTAGAAVLVGGIGVIMALAPDLWLGLFLDPSETGAWAAGRAYLQIVGPVYGAFAVGLALYFAGQGAGRVAWPVAAGFVRLVVAFGGALVLARVTGLGVETVFIAIALSILAYGGITAASVWLTSWR